MTWFKSSTVNFQLNYWYGKNVFSPVVKTVASLEACVEKKLEVVMLVTGAIGCSPAKK